MVGNGVSRYDDSGGFAWRAASAIADADTLHSIVAFSRTAVRKRTCANEPERVSADGSCARLAANNAATCSVLNGVSRDRDRARDIVVRPFRSKYANALKSTAFVRWMDLENCITRDRDLATCIARVYAALATVFDRIARDSDTPGPRSGLYCDALCRAILMKTAYPDSVVPGAENCISGRDCVEASARQGSAIVH